MDGTESPPNGDDASQRIWDAKRDFGTEQKLPVPRHPLTALAPALFFSDELAVVDETTNFMKRLILLLLFLGAIATTPAQASKPNDEAAGQFAANVAKKFLAALDRKRADVAEQYSYLRKTDLPTAGARKTPSPSAGVLRITIEAREKYGKRLSRELSETATMKDHSRLPDSKFVEFRYLLKFERKESIREVIKIKTEGERKGKVVFYSGG